MTGEPPPQQQALQDAARDRELAQYASDIVLIVDAEARVLYLNPSAERTMGYVPDEWVGRSGLEVIHPDDLELTMGAFGRALEQPGVNEPLELRVKRVGGGWRWFELVATNLLDHPAIGGVVLCARDITERVEALEALRLGEERMAQSARWYEAVLSHLSDLVSVIDADGNMKYLSPATLRLLGRDPLQRLGRSIFDFVHPDDAPDVAEHFARALAQPGLAEPFDARVLHDDGTYRTFEVRANNLLDDPGVQGIIVNSRDITDRVNAETALHESERLYRTIVEAADEGIWMIDDEEVTTFVNTRMAEMMHTTGASLIGRSSFEFADENGRLEAKHYLARRRAGIAERHDFNVLRDDGTTFWATVSASPLTDEDGRYRGTIALVTDLTERRAAEAALRDAELSRHRQQAELARHRLEVELNQSRRLESLGRLAAGVAHDFNNLIGVILNYAAAAANQLGAGSPAERDVTQIRKAAEQAAEVTRKLLTFGRADSLDSETFDLNELVDSIIRLVDRSFGTRIRLETRLAPDGCFVHADRSQIEQLLMNLLLNARDAVSGGGTITVTTDHESDGPPSAEGSPREVVLTVSDDGSGMTNDVVARAFEPFFTTKLGEQGSGLGLATVHAVVARSGGRVTIHSEPDAGTTVTVRLPEAPAEPPANP